MKSSFLSILSFLFLIGCSDSETAPELPEEELSLPTITTVVVSDITEVSAISGGNITDDGGDTITARGIVWGTSTGPTVSGNKIASGGGTGEFSSSLEGLDGNTTYYLRAYATNSAGTAYGNELKFNTLEPEPVAKVFEGDIRLATQTEVDDFGGENYSVIVGNVYIQGSLENPIVDLVSLGSWKKIEGELNIFHQTDLRNIDGMEGLSSVSGLTFIGDNLELENLDGLIGLTTANDLQILRNPKLMSLKGLKNLQNLFSFALMDNDALETIDGLEGVVEIERAIFIRNNNNLLNLDAFSNLKSMGSTLQIWSNDSLRSINGFNNLEYIGNYVSIERNTSLATIKGFGKLKVVEDFFAIRLNEKLIEIDALDSIRDGHRLEIEANRSLQRINILKSSNFFMGRIYIRFNNSLVEIDGFNELKFLRPSDSDFLSTIEIISNESLIGIPSFNSLIEIEGRINIFASGDYELNGFQKLETVSGSLAIGGLKKFEGFAELTFCSELILGRIRELNTLDNLSKVKKLGILSLYELPELLDLNVLLNLNELKIFMLDNCDKLTGIDGLRNMKRIDGISIRRNALLENLDGFQSLAEVSGTISITDNPSLVDFCGLQTLFDSGEFPNLDFSGNGFEPNFYNDSCSK